MPRREPVGEGAYVLREPEGDRDVTLIATGSEVEIAMAAATMLDRGRHRRRVVSMPCMELFAGAARGLSRRVLGTAPRVGIEAAVRQGWDRWIGAPRTASSA